MGIEVDHLASLKLYNHGDGWQRNVEWAVDEIESLTTKLAAAEAKVAELEKDNEALNKTLRDKGWGQGEIDSVTDLWERIAELEE